MNKFLTMQSLFFLSLCCLSSQILAQTRELSEQEFKKVEDSAYQKTNTENYRTMMKSQHFHHINDKKPYFQRSVTTEYNADDYHEISEDVKGNEVKRNETIKVNNRKYLRENSGKWKDITKSETNGFGGFASEEIRNKEIIESRNLGRQMVNGQAADIYEQRITRDYGNADGLSVNEKRIWLDQKGRYLKTETKSRIGDKYIFQMTVEYEYDPSIKVVAPKIK